VAERTLLRFGGGLLVGGFLLTVLATHEHPAGDDDNHLVIFTKYAGSHFWVAVHLVQFAGVLIALGGFLVLYRVLQVRGEIPVLAGFALGAAIASAATWAVLQAVDGVALKQAVDAWTAASGPQKAVRFADAETVRWTEWGINCYFRVLFGLTMVLFGAGIARTGIVARWLGWIAVLGGALYMATGIAVGYAGFESGFGDATGDALQLLFLVFVVGLLVAGLRRKEDLSAGASPRT
jgi:hypothetical protein